MYFNSEEREMLQPIKIPDDSISMAASPDNSAISTLFDKFKIDLQTENDALSGAIFTGFRVPVKTVSASKFIYYNQDLRGTVHKDADSRIVLLLDLGGETITIEFPQGKKFDGDLNRSFPRRVKNVGANSYLAALAIIVERRSVNSVAFVQLDSFDLTVGAKPKQK